MYNFEIKIPTEIYFDENAEAKVGKLIKSYGKKIMLCYGSMRIFNTGLGEKIVKALEEEGCQVVKQGGVKPNAETEYIDQAIKIVKEENIEAIVAVGGGSVIDSAKAISACAYANGSVIDVYKGIITPEKFLPIGAIVTVPATASESNGMSVVTDSNTHHKYSRFFEEVIPKFALLNPALTLTVSPYQTAVGGFDVFSHAFERFFDLRRKSYVLDQMTIGLMKSVVHILPKLIKDPNNIQYRSDMMYAATAAHNNMLGPGGDFACHQMSHAITTRYGIAHGGALAMIVPAWCEDMKEENRQRFEEFFGGVFDTTDADEGIMKLKDFVTSIGLSLNLETECDEANLLAEDVCGDDGFVGGGFKALSKNDVARIFRRFINDVA